MQATAGLFSPISKDAVLNGLLEQNKSENLWIFDCDGTLINSDIAELTAWGLLRAGLAHPEKLPEPFAHFRDTPVTWTDYLEMREHIINERGTTGYFEWEILLHAGLPPDAVHKVSKMSLADAKDTGKLFFTTPLSELAKKVASQSMIVSGSPFVCVAAVSEYIGISPHKIVATHLETVDGIFVDRLKEPGVIWEQLKKTELQKMNIHTPWIVCGDSIGDWDMMSLAQEWVWCVIWDEHRHRGLQFREHLQRHFGSTKIPEKPGIYLTSHHRKNWIVEVKDPNNI